MAWMLAVEGAILLGSFVYHRWIEDKPPPPKPATAALPQTAEGSAVPMIYGRCRVRAPVLAWAGNWFPNPHNTDDGIAWFTYTLSLLWVVGMPFYAGVVNLLGMWVGDAQLTLFFRPDSTPGGLDPNYVAPGRSRWGTSAGFNLYGGDGRGGGVTGEIEFFDGRQTQVISDGINHNDATQDKSQIQGWMTGDIPTDPSNPSGFTRGDIDASLIPSYRNLALAFLYTWTLGESPTVRSFSFEVKALSTGSSFDLGNSLVDDADPAAVIYDLLCSPWGKLSLPTSKIDIPSFAAASATLFSESHGFSRAIESPDDALNIITDILHQIDAVMYEEPTTSQIKLRLIRADYDSSLLNLITPDNAQLTSYSVQGWNEIYNQVRLTFTDRSVQFDQNGVPSTGYSDITIVAQNAANVVNQGGKLRAVDVKFQGCCDGTLAQKLASRELAAVSRPMVKATVTVNRSFYLARPGDVFKFTWPPLGINGMIMRVARVDLGQLHQGQIVMDLLRDIFDVSVGAFAYT